MSATDLGTAALRQLVNCNLAKAGLGINAAAAATIKTATGLLFSIGGILYSAAALANRALTVVPGASPLYTIPAGQTSYVLVVVNAAGTAFALQSDFKGRDLSFLGRIDKGDGTIPEVPTGYAPLGLIKIVVNPGQTFTPGVDALDAVAKAAVTFYDIQIVPAAP